MELGGKTLMMSDSTQIFGDAKEVLTEEKDIVFLCRRLKQNIVEGALINQLLRCGTSAGANVHEAQYAQGTKDFISKLEIAMKECNESEYWIDLLFEVNSLSKPEYDHFKKSLY